MTSTSIYDLSLEQCADLIQATGARTTFLVQGHIGIGKSALLKTLAERMPGHAPVYFDCTTKDLGDLMLPRIAEVSSGSKFVSFVPNEEFGIHLDRPVILMLDELGKANPSVKTGLTRLMYERAIGTSTLPKGSIVFATTNLAAEGVGDMFQAHQWNRLAVLTVRKPSYIEWLEWAINRGLEPALLGWVRDNPQLFQTFEEVKNPEDNPYIFHPRDPSRKAFVTGRSLERASNLISDCRGKVDDTVLTSALIGTVGARAAMDLMSFVTLANDLPTLDSIRTNPETAKIPSSAAGVCMVIYRTLSVLEGDWLDKWMVYLKRLDPEAQGLFANGVRARTYNKQAMVMHNRSFTEWVGQNRHMFGADQ